jgi:hypothetical protein
MNFCATTFPREGIFSPVTGRWDSEPGGRILGMQGHSSSAESEMTMKKLIGGTLLMALASLGWAAPQAKSTPGGDTAQTTKQSGKSSKQTKQSKRHAKKSQTEAAQPSK